MVQLFPPPRVTVVPSWRNDTVALPPGNVASNSKICLYLQIYPVKDTPLLWPSTLYAGPPVAACRSSDARPRRHAALRVIVALLSGSPGATYVSVPGVFGINPGSMDTAPLMVDSSFAGNSVPSLLCVTVTGIEVEEFKATVPGALALIWI